jgi:hypothetical protein
LEFEIYDFDYNLIQLLTWVDFGLIGYVPNTLYILTLEFMPSIPELPGGEKPHPECQVRVYNVRNMLDRVSRLDL